MASSLPTGGNIKLLLLLVAATLILPHSSCTATDDGAGNRSLAKPGCSDKCGNVSIFYPFGIGEDCFRQGFEVQCTADNIARLNTSGTPLLEINLTFGEARVGSPIAWYCNYTNGTTTEYSRIFEVADPYFTVSGTKNKFTAIGCATVAFVAGHNKHDYNSACGSSCYDVDSIDNSTECSGMGCCQTTIPGNLDIFDIGFSTNDVDNTQVWNFSPCSYGFMIDQDTFKFDPSYAKSTYFKEEYGDGVPLVLDWVVDNETCSQAKKNHSSYACLDKNSLCIDTPGGPGYLCRCSQGYEGNPYLDGSCQDIN